MGEREKKRERKRFSIIFNSVSKNTPKPPTSFFPFTRLKLTCVQALCYCGGVDEVTGAKVADNVFVQVLDLQLDLLLDTQTKQTILNVYYTNKYILNKYIPKWPV